MKAPINYFGGKNILLDNGFTKSKFTTNNRVETLWQNY